ncbi:MAG: helix-turn-helix domain-containing protein [Oscillospiraceae bacterium]|nr:helix-turn-helix domain-containing protein [Oscillospiraceae bacterium]
MYENFEHEILTVEELMELLYIGKNTAYQLLNSGEIRAFRIGRVWKIPKEAVGEYVVRKAKGIE